jgi:hypothetical protein
MVFKDFITGAYNYGFKPDGKWLTMTILNLN